MNFVPGGVGGVNLGWNCREGSNCFSVGNCCNAAAFTDPIYEYDNTSTSCAVAQEPTSCMVVPTMTSYSADRASIR